MKVNKWIAVALCLCVLFAVLPLSAFAQEAPVLEIEMPSITVTDELPQQGAAAEIPAAAAEAPENVSGETDAEQLEEEVSETVSETLTALAEAVPAEETPEPDVVAESAVHVNPLYSDTVTEEMLEAASAGTVMPLSDPPSYTEAKFSDAVSYFREGARCRAETVSFVYITDDYDQTRVFDDKTYRKAALSEVAHALWEGALEHTGVPDEGDYIRWNYKGWKVSAYIGKSGSSLKFSLTYTLVYYTTAEQEEIFSERAAAVLEEQLSDGMNDYEKVCAIYDYICDHVTYDYTHLGDDTYTLKQTAYAALIHGTSVCQGYASLFYYMALSCGIDARLIAGYGNGEAHGWNIVKIRDSYYCLDATWDSSRTSYTYFLKGKNTFNGHTPDAEYCSDAFYAQYPVSETDYDPNRYIDFGMLSDGLEWELSKDGVLTISGTGAMEGYLQSGEAPWSDHLDSITAVVIEEGVTAVGAYTFHGCDAVTSVVLPEGLEYIGGDAFAGCSGLTEIVFPESLSEIGGYAFSGCEGLSKVELPTSVVAVGTGAFAGCGLTEITVCNPECAIGSDETTLGGPADTVIVGWRNSTAQTYGEEFGYAFVVLADMNDDGQMNAADIIVMMKAVTGDEPLAEESHGDLNGDRNVDILDVIRLIRLCAEA